MTGLFLFLMRTLVSIGLFIDKIFYKIERDPIQGLTKPGLLRVMKRAGVKRVDGLVYEHLRGLVQNFLDKLLNYSITYLGHLRKNTLATELSIKSCEFLL